MVIIFTTCYEIAVNDCMLAAILSALNTGLRESSHSNGNGYSHFVNECDPDRYLSVLGVVAPDDSRVKRRQSHSTGPCRKKCNQIMEKRRFASHTGTTNNSSSRRLNCINRPSW